MPCHKHSRAVDNAKTGARSELAAGCGSRMVRANITRKPGHKKHLKSNFSPLPDIFNRSIVLPIGCPPAKVNSICREGAKRRVCTSFRESPITSKILAMDVADCVVEHGFAATPCPGMLPLDQTGSSRVPEGAQTCVATISL
jgi:hypothetical protein